MGFVIDNFGLVHHISNWEALRKRLSPEWLSILGPGRPTGPPGFFLSSIPLFADPSIPKNALEVRSGTQRVRVRWVDEDEEVSRWEDDGGASL